MGEPVYTIGASEVIIASIRPAKAVAAYLEERNSDLVILPSGFSGRFSLEDTWWAGQLLSYLPITDFGDGAKVAKLLQATMPIEELANGEDGTILQSLGLHGDIEFCLEQDVSSGVIALDKQSGWCSLLQDKRIAAYHPQNGMIGCYIYSGKNFPLLLIVIIKSLNLLGLVGKLPATWKPHKEHFSRSSS